MTMRNWAERIDGCIYYRIDTRTHGRIILRSSVGAEARVIEKTSWRVPMRIGAASPYGDIVQRVQEEGGR